MSYLSQATYEILIAIFVGFWIFWLVDFVHWLFLKTAKTLTLEKSDKEQDINIFVGHDITPKKFKIKK